MAHSLKQFLAVFSLAGVLFAMPAMVDDLGQEPASELPEFLPDSGLNAGPEPQTVVAAIERDRVPEGTTGHRSGQVASGILEAEQDLNGEQRSFRASFEQLLDGALGGSREDVILVADIRRKCGGGFLSGEFVTGVLEQVQADGFSSESQYFTGRGELASFESFDAYEAFLWRRYEDCTAVISIFDRALRNDVLARAENGLPAARYFFAMWPPEARLTRPKSALEQIEYQELALRFTLQNVEEMEPLGLFALGQSYAGGGYGDRLFTPHDDELGSVFLMAAHECGIRTPWLNAEVRKAGRRNDRLRARGLETGELVSGSLSLEFCIQGGQN